MHNLQHLLNKKIKVKQLPKHVCWTEVYYVSDKPVLQPKPTRK